MSGSGKGLGRGLDALFAGSAVQQESEGPVAEVALKDLHPNPHQPRRRFDADGLQELAASIRMQGIIQPLLVRPLPGGKGYQIVAGERRWRAAQLAGLERAPVYVRQMSEKEVMAAALIENLQREDLNPMEEAEALQALRQALDLTLEELAARLGRSRPSVSNALRLLQLSREARQDLEEGRLTAGHARCLLGVDAAEAAESLRCRIVEHNLTVREAEEAAAYWRGHNALPWDAAAPAPASAPAPRAARKKSQEIKVLQQNLCRSLGCRARISGDENAGRIALPYSSREELDALLLKLGLTPGQESSDE